jgi:hypothetical protein
MLSAVVSHRGMVGSGNLLAMLPKQAGSENDGKPQS